MNPAKAMELAKSLTVVPGYPAHAEGIREVGIELEALCPTDGEGLDLFEQVRLWDRWQGLGALRETFRGMSIPLEQREWQNPHKPIDPVCLTCHDTGYNKSAEGKAERCTCANGEALPQGLLDRMNRQNAAPANVLSIRRDISPQHYTEEGVDPHRQKQVDAMQPITQADVAALMGRKGRA